MPDQMLTVKQAAPLLGLSGSQVRALIDSGDLEACDFSVRTSVPNGRRRNRSLRISLAAIEAFIERRKLRQSVEGERHLTLISGGEVA